MHAHTHTHTHTHTHMFFLSLAQKLVTESHFPKRETGLGNRALNAAFFTFCLQHFFINRFAKLMLNSLISGSY